MKRRPSQILAYLILSTTAAFSILYIAYVFRALEGSRIGWFALGLLSFKTGVEIVASGYGFAFLFGSMLYLFSRRTPKSTAMAADCPPIGIIYLCCDDLDIDALLSLVKLKYRGKRYLIIHDDSRSDSGRTQVDAVAERVRVQGLMEVMVLRRPVRQGGKAGAVNYVLDRTSHLYEYFLLCDNDSTALDVASIEKALPYFQEERVAIVQCRNVAVECPEYSPVNRLLSRSINAFHVYFSVQSRFGWQPFIGHNAFLRTKAVREVGGLTPGFFSDDLDLTVRLNLAGYSIIYSPEICIGEKHPPSYTSFRKRTYKWAYGCMQTLKAHAWSVLTSSHFSIAEKLSFFQFAGFYVGQTLLLMYLGVTFIVTPLVLHMYALSLPVSLITGSLIIALIYLPVLVYFLKEGTLAECFGTVVACGLVYGATDFSVARGVWDCLWSREREWTPTNGRQSQECSQTGLALEALYGTLLLSLPALSFPPLLYLPSSYLFGGKFLFGPAISLLYDDHAVRFAPRWRTSIASFIVVMLLVPLFVMNFPTVGHTSTASRKVEIQGKNLLVEGRQFQIKGIHYGPWRPGTGPNKGYPYPSEKEIDEDLSLINKLNANTILVFDPPGYVLDAAERHGLMVLYCFSVNWWTIGTTEYQPERDSILKRVQEIRDKPALLGWVLGNEIPADVLAMRGEQVFENELKDLYLAVKEKDHLHPITHSNWPPTKTVNLKFLDFLSFNLYPLWPPEVVATGYGNYITQVLQPIAGEKPLVITEYGANSIEAKEDGQARLMEQCWRELLKAGAAGGVAFEFADEWWKNYDNPRRPGDWWYRVPAPDDEKTDDLDPEEHYGLVTATRQPKMSFATVSAAYAATASPQMTTAVLPFMIIVFLILAAFAAWLWARRQRRAPARMRSFAKP